MNGPSPRQQKLIKENRHDYYLYEGASLVPMQKCPTKILDSVN